MTIASKTNMLSWTHRNPMKVISALSLLAFVISILAMGIGRYYVPSLTILKMPLAEIFPIEKTWSRTIECVIYDVRLPRIMAGILVGAGLSVSGAAFQGMFRNPLVSSQILGVSSGAGFGAAIAILLFDSLVIIQISSFVFGLLAVAITFLISRMKSSTPILMLVLSGIVVGSLFSALTSLVKYMADPMNKMPAIVFWLLGSLNHVAGKDIKVFGPVIVVTITIMLLIRWKINVLTMGDDDAKALGVNTERLKLIIILCSTVLTASAVCLCGIIGWIGLVVPHIGRMLVGPDNRYLLPTTILTGAAFLVVVDTLARSLSASEIPLGILTSIIGAPLFAFLLRRNKIGW